MLVLENFAHVLNKWSLDNYSEANLGPYQTSMIELFYKNSLRLKFKIQNYSRKKSFIIDVWKVVNTQLQFQCWLSIVPWNYTEWNLRCLRSLSEKKTIHGKLASNYISTGTSINPCRPDPGPRKKITLIFFCSHFFLVPRKVLWRPSILFEAPQISIKIKSKF